MPTAVIALPSLPKLFEPENDQPPSLWRGAAAEFFATLIFVFVGCGSVVACEAQLATSSIHVASQLTIAFAHGFAIMVLVYAVGEISGGHINPAVTWACVFTGKISVLRAVVYIFSQLFGSVCGASLLRSVLPPDVRELGMGTHGINPAMNAGQGFGAETIFTFIFIFVVFATAISPFAGKFSPLSGGTSGKVYGPGKLTPFAVGMTILILHLVGIPFTGASMNPARTFGPALINDKWANHWVYWIGPWLGSTIAAITAQLVFLSTPRDIFKLNLDSTLQVKDFIDGKEPEKEKPILPVKAIKTSNGAPRKVVIKAPVKSTTIVETPTPLEDPKAQRSQEKVVDMRKSPSGQFSPIMEEDSSVVELEDLN